MQNMEEVYTILLTRILGGGGGKPFPAFRQTFSTVFVKVLKCKSEFSIMLKGHRPHKIHVHVQLI